MVDDVELDYIDQFALNGLDNLETLHISSSKKSLSFHPQAFVQLKNLRKNCHLCTAN